jgi:hypothetical protein
MTIATGTATLVEINALYAKVQKLEVMLRPYHQGDATVLKPGRFTIAACDTAIGEVTTAITAVNA